MKQRALLVVIAPVAFALALSTTQLAEAREGRDTSVLDDVRAAVVAEGVTSPAEPGSRRAALGREGTRAWVDSSSLDVALPGRATTPQAAGKFTVGVTQGFGFRTVVEQAEQGSFRVLIHVDRAEASDRYDFALPSDVTASLQPDGGVLVRDRRGDVVGIFAPAWARDAAGYRVMTRYEVRGTTITQVVHPRPGTRYPVVADPWWIPVIILGRLIFGVITRHAAKQAAARGISHALIRDVIRTGARSRGNGNTTIFTRGKGSNRIRVVVDNKSGNVITVTKG